MVALFDSNPQAFAGGNMNRLRAGKILRVPAADEVAKIDPATARKLVIEQTSEFAAYRRRLAGAVAAAPVEAATPQQQATGTIRPQVEDKTPPPPTKDKLEVSRTEPAKAKPAAGGSSLEEDLIARDKALREAAERIALLEKNIKNLTKLVEIKSQTGAALQQHSEAAPAAVSVKPAEPAKSEAEAPKVEEPKPTAPAQAGEKPAEPAPFAASPKPASPPESVESPSAEKKSIPPEPLSEPEPEEEPGFIDENPQLVYGAGGIVALLLLYLGYRVRQRRHIPTEAKKSIPPVGEAIGVTSSSSQPEAAGLLERLTKVLRREKAQGKMAPAAKEMAPAAESPAISPSSSAPSTDDIPATSIESNDFTIQSEFFDEAWKKTEADDPLAEAEVLIAYGREQQAVDVLRAALAKSPTRTAIHMKLLELFAKHKNSAQFKEVARKFHDLCAGRGAEWQQVVALADALGLHDEIFVAEAREAATAVASPSSPVALASAKTSIAETEGLPAAKKVPSTAYSGFDLASGVPTLSESTVTIQLHAPAQGPRTEEEGKSLDIDLGLDTDQLARDERAGSTWGEKPA
ncbi:MAG: FimV family protein, partial [Rhodocyclaceae bacterium]